MGQQIPLAEGLFTWPSDQPALIAGRVRETGQVMFPRREQVMLDDGSLVETETVELARRGRLWTFTTQGFPPPLKDFVGSTKPYVPFSVGYVELDGGLLVQARLTEPDPAKLTIGQEMELVIETIGADADGNDLVMFAFSPIAAEVAA
jgi:uncharacterized OB-fold protein